MERTRNFAWWHARSLCKVVERILACGGDVELIPHLIEDIGDALYVWGENGGRGEN